MENASKALIIAGAILLSILIISLGILVYNNAKGAVEDANLSDQEIASYNSKFSGFIGQNKSPEMVEQLLQVAYESYNANKKGLSNTGLRIVYFSTGAPKAEGVSPTATTSVNSIFNKKEVIKNQLYRIQAVYYPSDNKNAGLIKGFYISPQAWK